MGYNSAMEYQKSAEGEQTMPELPEVETVRQIIGPQIVENIVEKVEIFNSRVIASLDTEAENAGTLKSAEKAS